MKYVLLCFCLGLCVMDTYGACFIPKTYDKFHTHCQYKNFPKFKVGESREYYGNTCERCECSDSELSCCGIGINAGVVHVEKGFEIKRLPACEFEIVPKRQIKREKKKNGFRHKLKQILGEIRAKDGDKQNEKKNDFYLLVKEILRANGYEVYK